MFKPRQLAQALARAGVRVDGVGFAHAFHSPYWGVRALIGLDDERAAPTRAFRAFLVKAAFSRRLSTIERMFDWVWPKSLVLYGTRVATGRRMRVAFLCYRGNMQSGGQGIYLHALTRELAQLGCHIDVYVGPPYPDPLPWAREFRIENQRFWGKRFDKRPGAFLDRARAVLDPPAARLLRVRGDPLRLPARAVRVQPARRRARWCARRSAARATTWFTTCSPSATGCWDCRRWACRS